MRILLVRPPVSLAIARSFHAFLHLEPLDLEIVAGGVDGKHETRIMDLTVAPKPLALFVRTLKEFQPHILGLGGYSNQAANMLALARKAKEVRPDCLVVVGGIHASIAPETLKHPGVVDVVVRGEGASAIRRLVAAFDAGEALPCDEYILPVTHPAFDQSAMQPPPPLPPYHEVPSPRRDLIVPSDYFCVVSGRQGERLPTLFPQVATMRTSTGCPYRCNFCVVHHLARGKYLQREPQDVVDEIKSIDASLIYFVDDEMFINPVRTRKIAELLKEQGVHKHYISWARSDTICRHEDVFRLWQEVGLKVLYVGLESMQPKNLADYNKGTNPELNRRAVEILRGLDIQLHAALMINPDFTKEDFLAVRQTIDQLAPAEITFTVLSPSPGTDLWHKHRQEFLDVDPYAFYDCMHTLLPTRLPLPTFYKYFSLLYLFAFQNNPWRLNKNKAPIRDIIRLLASGVRCGWLLRRLYRDYAAIATPQIRGK